MKRIFIGLGITLAVATTAFFGIMKVQAAPGQMAADANAACNSCHAKEGLILSLPDGEKLDLQVDPAKMAESVHNQVRCTTCHATIQGFPHPPVQAGSLQEYKLSQENLCGNCHPQAKNEMQNSVHRQSGVTETATCGDCHTAHEVQQTNTGSFRAKSAMVCSNCHGNKEMMAKYTVSTDVVNPYLQDFHGKTAMLEALSGKENIDVAVCADCHGAHNVQMVEAPTSMVSQNNLANTCATCHEGATAKFTSAWLSHQQPSLQNSQIVFFVRWFYRLMIPFILVGLLAHILIDLRKQIVREKGE